MARTRPGRSTAAGAFFCFTGGVHVGIVAADAGSYSGFADEALFGFVRSGWDDVFLANPEMWGLLLALGEIGLGVLLLLGGALAKVGWVGTIVFQALLVLFGWGFLFWSVPACVVFALGARHDWPLLEQRHGAVDPRASS